MTGSLGWLGAAAATAPVLPAGVTLAAIDGETLLTSTTMSNNYYARNGYTAAVAAGWDSPSFYPLGPWEAPLDTQTHANLWATLGWNTAFYLDGSSNSALLYPTNPIHFIDAVQGTATLTYGDTAALIGLNSFDEPSTFAQGVSTPLTTMANAHQDTRFWWSNNTWNFYAFGPPTGTPGAGKQAAYMSALETTPGGAQRHIDVGSCDMYIMSYSKPSMGAGSTSPYGGSQYQLGLIYGLGGTIAAPGMTTDQAYRPFHYGNIAAEKMRGYQVTYPAPIFNFVETGQPDSFTSGDSLDGEWYISPPQLNAAIWSNIIHGVRGISFFDHTFFGPGISDANVYSSYYTTVQSSFHDWGTLGGAARSKSIVQQLTDTAALVKTLAPIINSPFAHGYVTAVSPSGGWKHGDGFSTSLVGMDYCVKWYQGGGALTNGFYIFVMPRYSQTNVNQTVTITLTDTTRTSITELTTNTSITAVAGVFSDVLPDGNAVRIYRVN